MAFYITHGGVSPEEIINATPLERMVYRIGQQKYYDDMTQIIANGIAMCLSAIADGAEESGALDKLRGVGKIA